MAATDYITSTANLPLYNGTGKATTSSASNTSSAAAASGTALAKDFNNFLLLLTTQLKNQDPTEPMDTNAMAQQLATFAGVEQQVATNKNMEKLVSLFTGGQMDQMVGYIGRTVEAEGGQAELKSGQAYFSYEVPAGAKEVVLSVLDSSGSAIFTANGDTKAGRQGIVWDGTNNFSGQKMADGVYQLSVSAMDGQGKPLTSKVYTNGVVTAVQSGSNGSEAMLKLGNISLPLSKVQTVRQSVTAPTIADATANTAS